MDIDDDIACDEGIPLPRGQQVRDALQYLTVNARMATAYQNLWLDQCMADGQHVIAGQRFISWQEWLNQMYVNLSYQTKMPVVLNRWAERTIWQQVIDQHPPLCPMYHPDQLALLCQEAYAYQQGWLVSDKQIHDHLPSDDVKQYLKWHEAFQQRLKDSNWTCESSKLSFIIEHLAQLKPELCREYVVVGFDQFSPQMNALFERMSQLGVVVKKHAPPSAVAWHDISAYKDQNSEIHGVLAQALDHIKHHPGERVAIVMANLHVKRPAIQAWIQQQVLFNNMKQAMPFNISGGDPLWSWPIVQSAFALLHLVVDHDVQVMQEVLLSCYVGDSDELSARHGIDAYLRSQYEGTTRISDWLQASTFETAPNFYRQLEHLKQLASPADQHWADHIEFFQGIWAAMAWPTHPGGLDSQDYQCAMRCHALLESALSMATVLPQAMSYRKALSIFEQMAKETMFSPQTRGQTSIEILSHLEITGLTFDAIYCLGMDQTEWPQPTRLNPFLPVGLQKTLEMPHSTADIQLDFAHKLLARMHQQTKALHLSYAQSKQGVECLMSPIIKRPDQEGQTLLSDPHKKQVWKVKMQTLEDDCLPMANRSYPGANSLVAIIKAQANCPFQALIKQRLQVKSFPQPESMQFIQRGQMIHDALEHLWGKLKDHQTLQSQSDAALKQLIEKALDTSAAGFQSTSADVLSSHFFKLEQQHLSRLLWDWMQLEKQRPMGFDVVALEKGLSFDFMGRVFQLRVDRVDRLANGDHVLIDYKTGAQVSTASWFQTPGLLPQIPIYALALECQGVTFAQLHSSSLGFKGISQKTSPGDGIDVIGEGKRLSIQDWSGLLAFWSLELEAMYQAYDEGRAEVAPTQGALSCQQCDLQALCRIYQSPKSSSQQPH